MENDKNKISIYDVLTPQEIKVIELAAKGYKGKEIAEKLFISYETVRNHTKNILSKTASHTLAGAVCIAMKKGLIVAL